MDRKTRESGRFDPKHENIFCQFICQKLAFKLANKFNQISRFDSQILTTHLLAFLLPSLEITFFLRSFSMRYLTILIERSDLDEISVIETEGLAVIIDSIV